MTSAQTDLKMIANMRNKFATIAERSTVQAAPIWIWSAKENIQWSSNGLRDWVSTIMNSARVLSWDDKANVEPISHSLRKAAVTIVRCSRYRRMGHRLVDGEIHSITYIEPAQPKLTGIDCILIILQPISWYPQGNDQFHEDGAIADAVDQGRNTLSESAAASQKWDGRMIIFLEYYLVSLESLTSLNFSPPILTPNSQL